MPGIALQPAGIGNPVLKCDHKQSVPRASAVNLIAYPRQNGRRFLQCLVCALPFLSFSSLEIVDQIDGIYTL
jgi:hypothetical protein